MIEYCHWASAALITMRQNILVWAVTFRKDMWLLTIRTSNEKVIEFLPNQGVTSFGRTEENDIVLKDDAVSRHHAEMLFDHENKSLSVRDLGSTNGTYVNGRRIKAVFELEHGDQVRIGKSLISIKSADTKQLESKENIVSLSLEVTQALLVESIDNFGLLLNDLSNRLVNVTDKDEALKVIGNFTSNMIDSTESKVILQENFYVLENIGIPSSITKTVIEDRTPTLLSNIQADKDLTESLASSKINSLILVPVHIGPSLVGIIYTYQEGEVAKPFDRNDLQLVMAVSSQVALTLQRFEHEKELIYQANHDSLTKLPNRTRFLDRLEQALLRSRREDDYIFAVFFFDVDNFKLINDSLGHVVGDEILTAIGKRLIRNFRDVDLIARLGGDEFVILYDSLKIIEDTIPIAERLFECFRQPFVVNGKEIFITISVGGTTNLMNYSDPVEVLRDADIAMYRAKAAGGNKFQLYDSEMHQELVTLMELHSGVRKAIRKEELVLYYQPVISLQSGQIMGLEALVRWNSPERGFLGPKDFLFHLDTTSLLNDLDLWVLAKALEDFSLLRSRFPAAKDMFVSVNISERTFFHKEILQLIDQVLAKAHFQPENLVFEITEQANIKSEELVIRVMDDLRAKGIRLSLDDFGTGYSTLGYLHRFPVDFLKIDRSFIESVEKATENTRIVETIVGLAEHIGMKVIAEGVETKEQMEFLRKIKCDYAQGFYLSHPVELQKILELLEETPDALITS